MTDDRAATGDAPSGEGSSPRRRGTRCLELKSVYAKLSGAREVSRERTEEGDVWTFDQTGRPTGVIVNDSTCFSTASTPLMTPCPTAAPAYRRRD